jgi:outer membrane protein assembly factor BamE (lipoprotein component of BamABCDE complex)
MKKYLLLISIFFLITNCNLKQNVEHHGVNMLEKKNAKLIINETNKNDIFKILGPPSVQSTFDNDIMFYIERKILIEGIYKLGKRKIVKNNVLIVEVNNRGILVKKEFVDLSQMNELDIYKKTTAIDYQKTSFIYDFLSSMRQKVNDPLGKKKRGKK